MTNSDQIPFKDILNLNKKGDFITVYQKYKTHLHRTNRVIYSCLCYECIIHLFTETSNVGHKGKGKWKKSDKFNFLKKQTWRMLNTRKNICRDVNVTLHFFQRRRCLKKNLSNKVTYAELSFHGECPKYWIIIHTFSRMYSFP